MANSFNEIMEVKAFLRQQHINVSEEWTEACIDFLKQEQVCPSFIIAVYIMLMGLLRNAKYFEEFPF